MKSIIVFGVTLLLVVLFATGAGADGTPEARGVTRSGVRLSLFTDSEMDFQILRSLGADAAGGGTVGEILIAALQIEDGNPASWSAAFLSLAERLEKDGAARLERGHTVSARESFLRASSYYRAAEYYGDPLSEDTRSWGMKCRETFLKAMKHFPWKTEAVFIPTGKDEDFYPGYFITQGKGGKRRKTLIAQSGFDGTAEEMFLSVGRAALDRGYNVLLFEGPGQAGKRRFHPDSTFVSDLGPTVRTVMDFLLKRPEVNPKQVALYGASFGGYFAQSGALGEPRLGALILNSPLTDIHEYFLASLGEQTVDMLKKNNLTVEDLKTLSEKDMPPKYRLSLLNLCVRFGRPSVAETLDVFSFFRIPDDRLKSLAMPALGLVSAGEGPTPLKQAEHFAAAAPKASLHVFERESGANAHCQLDNPPLSWAVTLDWLDELFR